MNEQQPPTTSVAIIGQVEPSPPVVAVGLDWSVLIPLIFAGFALLITTFVSAWQAIRVKQAVAQNAITGAKAGEAQDKKLDNITILVDGRYSQVLQELADVKRLLAAESGLAVDQAKADAAQERANDQASRVAIAAAASDAPAEGKAGAA